jgi:hypothetical protein
MHPRLSPLAHQTKIVGVMFADRGADNGLLELMASGFAGVMSDIAGAVWLIDCMTSPPCASSARVGTMADGGVAGRSVADVRGCLLEPDYLGFRGALYAGRDRPPASIPRRSRSSAAHSFRRPRWRRPR